MVQRLGYHALTVVVGVRLPVAERLASFFFPYIGIAFGGCGTPASLPRVDAALLRFFFIFNYFALLVLSISWSFHPDTTHATRSTPWDSQYNSG